MMTFKQNNLNKKSKQLLNILVVLIVFVMLVPPAMAAEKLTVFVSIAPQKYFVQQIGKDRVDVHVMVPPGAEPHTYEPKPAQMVKLAKARYYLACGVEFEQASLKKIAAVNPAMEIIHTDRGIKKIKMVEHHHDHGVHDDEHGHEKHHKDDHAHEKHHDEDRHDADQEHGDGLDPHIWLSPALVKIQSDFILQALIKADPAHKQSYLLNHDAFVKQADKLDHDIRKLFKGRQGMGFMVFHPSWGYFAHDYGLKQIPVEIEGKDPKPAQLKSLISHARQENIRVVFVQPQFSSKSAKIVAREIKGRVVVVDPLAEDWLDNMRNVAEKFREALQ